MRKSTLVGVALASFIMTGCSEMSMPTSPSATFLAVNDSGATGAGQTSLNWNATSPGCTPDRPLPDVAGEPTHMRELTAAELYFRPGAVLAQWMRDRGDTVWAVFYPASSGHELCLWDTAGI